MGSTIIKNIGTILSGDIDNPVLKGDTIVVTDGKIAAIGGAEVASGIEAEKVIDAAGSTVTPGLFDTHVHTSLGDYAHRQFASNFIEGELHGGVTTIISAGEVHTPGRPKDPAGTKALAVLAHKSFAALKPAGVKVHGGSLILEKGLVEKDFEELAKEGVWTVGEIGLGSVKNPEDAAPMVEWAHKNGMKVQMHTGGTSIPGSSTVTAEQVMATKPDVISHINGGPTAIPLHEVDKLMDETTFAMEIVQCGNPKVTDYVARRAQEKGQLGRIIFGNDAPSGTGIIPLGILRNICQVSSVSGIPGEIALCMATGNSAKVYDRLNTGMIAVGREADLVFMDAPMGSVAETAVEAFECGDIPGLSIIMVDGVVKAAKSKNTPPCKRAAKVV
ncbi:MULTISPECIES: amidohydrolase family protein [Oscillospiraceae]|uniref:Amidohydrolase family protein n=1 Tax=Lawsonibacter faecis TaxID=2763052 RepID=A0A8J6JN77_9FIRM|nr:MULTISPECIES: amidohydrolase family protein [Oscillospiraceae]MBC5738384.1 amidohydrolase family protein [Lawsonibacter faecis]MCQ4865392.1 amidohydrolase family protein [Pseudoflavonifractor phocaeensis]